jgi:nucleotide-binding universal stress UspA family protein
MKILVAIDGSPHAQATLESLAARLQWFRDTPSITLMYVHPPLPYGIAAKWVGKHTVETYYDEESDQALAGARACLDGKSVAYDVVKKVGDAADEIVSHAARQKFDLLVMGTHGHTALAKLVLGSVATKVLAGSSVPVMLFRMAR